MQRLENLSPEELIERALAAGEGVLASNGALTVTTGQRTGRSPADRFIVRDEMTDSTVGWGEVNRPIPPAAMDALWQRVEQYLGEREHYFCQLHAGADARYSLPLAVRTETAWHALFANNIFIRPQVPNPTRPTGYNPDGRPEWRIMNAPGFVCDPARDGTNSDGVVIIDFSGRRILLAGMRYAGEMKKAVFSVLNYLLPEKDVLPMHCSANVSPSGETVLFFGLSGTGKTTLSADSTRALVGDDEHGWGDGSVFNFEGGCYAKCINLSRESEPVIWDAIRRGSIMENVILDADGNPDFADDSLTENTRCCYPRDFIENRVEANQAGEPVAIVFLTCDLRGVMPPVSILTPEAAAYHFLSGYTASMAGVEVGGGVKSTFSACFGAPFFPRPVQEYADLLIKRMRLAQVPAYLVNTGWSGGGYGEGNRFPIALTRQVVASVQDGTIGKVPTQRLEGLNLEVPTELPGVESRLLLPRNAWSNVSQYDESLNVLVDQFRENFSRFNISSNIATAGPG